MSRMVRYTSVPVVQSVRDRCPEYRVATEALAIAADLGCSGDLYDALQDLAEREFDAFATREIAGL